eukprot:4598503-Alexandrium_andersonii.AAC.1
MSASLVGSEMCIRDRPCAAPGATTGGGAERPGPGWADGSRGAPRCGGALRCLLYTSDAADDM